MRRQALLLCVCAAAASAVASTARATPTSGPAAAAYIQLQTTRAALANKESGFSDPWVRTYVEQSIALLDSALTPARWTNYGIAYFPAEFELGDLRQAAAWLVWADPTLMSATVSDQRNIIWSAGQVVRVRFNDVRGFIGEGGGASPWSLWASEYMLNLGDAQLVDDIMAASLSYQSAWQYLEGQPPCCA